MRDGVAAHYKEISQAFADIDYAKIGVVTKDDFRQVLDKYTIRMTDEQACDSPEWFLLVNFENFFEIMYL